MARLWLAVALCVVIFLVLANDAEARRKRSCSRKSVGHRTKSYHKSGGHHKSRHVGHHKGHHKGNCKSKSHHGGHNLKGRHKAGKCRKRHGHKAHVHKAHGHNGHYHKHGKHGKGKGCSKKRKGGWKGNHGSRRRNRNGLLNIFHGHKKRKCRKSKGHRNTHQHHHGGKSNSSHKGRHHHAKNSKQKENPSRGRHSRGKSSGSSHEHHHRNKNNKSKAGGKRKKKHRSSSSSSSSSSSASSSGKGHHHNNKNNKHKNKPWRRDRGDACLSNPCMNGAKCYNRRKNGFRCVCETGFRGKRCASAITDKVGPCDSNPCLNHGRCIPNNQQYRCSCQRGFAGTNCQIAPKTFDPCKELQCKNGGRCESANGLAWCVCRDGFEGKYCSHVIAKDGPCKDNPCANGGDCHVADDGASYWCNCLDNWEGLRCLIAIRRNGPCHDNPCKNGRCVPMDGGLYRCRCNRGYSGDHCDVAPKKNPCADKPCENNGICAALDNGDFNCKCRKGFEGDLCETGKSRPGLCPASSLGACLLAIQGCNSDSECPGEEEKCCSNGCTRVCKKPCRIICRKYCSNGYVFDNNGCPTCECNEEIKVPEEEVEPAKPRVADVVGKEVIAYIHPIDLSRPTRIKLSVIWDTDLRISFKHPGSSDSFYIVYIGWETAHIDLCSDGVCQIVKDADTKGILRKSAVESINFYIIISQSDFIIGLDNPDYELMSYHNDNPITGQAKMFIFGGGSFPVDWDVKKPIIEDSLTVQIDTDSRGTVIDLEQIKPLDLHRTNKLRFSFIGGIQLQIGLRSSMDLKKYIVVHIGQYTSSIEECDEAEVCVMSDEVETVGDINDQSFVNYFIIFGRDGSVSVVHEDTQTEFLTYTIGETREGPFIVFISSGNGQTASWKVHQSTTVQEDTITLKPHVVEQNDNDWTFISEQIRQFEKSIQVGVAADSEVHVALMEHKTDEANAYEIVIGAEEKTKIIIKKGSSQISAESYVLSSSNVDEFSDFWISWLDGNLCIGEFENYKYKDAIVCANDEGDYNFRWAGFKGDWLDYIAYYSFEYSVSYGTFFTYDSRMAYPMRFKRARMVGNKLEFGVMTDSDAHLAVAGCEGSDTATAPMYELVMGTHANEGCFFRRCKGCPILAEGKCHGMLDETEHKDYTFEFDNGHLRLYRGRGSSNELLLSWDDPNPLEHVQYLATATGFHSSGSSHWILYHP